MDFQEISEILVGTPDKAIKFLRSKGLMTTTDCCDCCGMALKEYHCLRNNDNVSWRCLEVSCEKYSRYFSIRRKSFFDDFTIPLNKCVHLLYLWNMERSQKSANEDSGISPSVIGKFYVKMRSCCKLFYENNKLLLGGHHRIVQIDESLFR